MNVFGPPMRRSVRKSAGSVTSPNASQKKAEVYIEKDGQAQPVLPQLVPAAVYRHTGRDRRLSLPVPLVVGFTDGKMTQVLEGKLSAGDKVIVDQRRGAK